MSGFSAEWLALREPADHRARNQELLKLVKEYFEVKTCTADHPLRILDLGCGSGSNLRGLSEALPNHQHWTLIDYDVLLLQTAREQLMKWADECLDDNCQQATAKNLCHPCPSLSLKHQHKQITVDFVQIDLARDIEKVLAMPADLVSAAAFFDLVSAQWIERFCNALVVPLYTVLTYDGEESWNPVGPDDQEVLKAFHGHQASDKGFGIAAGPAATLILEKALARASFATTVRASPWLLTQKLDQQLMRSLAQGSAQAVSETKQISPDYLKAWLNLHEQASSCVIGHQDLWARP
jgi:SAM-dependent methyltransferase